MDAMFSPRTAAPVARARQHSLGDLLHRSAARYPDKLAVVAGDLRVSYAQNGSGGMTASVIGYVGAVTTTGTVASIAVDGSSFTVQTAGGAVLTFSTATNPELLSALEVGDTIQVTYTKAPTGILTARSLAVTAGSVAAQATGTIIAIAADLSSFTVQAASGQDLTFATGGLTSGILGFQVGESVQVNYTQAGDGALTATQVVAAQSGGLVDRRSSILRAEHVGTFVHPSAG